MRATKAIIHLDRLKSNIRMTRGHLRKDSNAAICMPVKADAYGHGVARIAEEAIRCGVDYLAVAAVDEGLELRNAGISAPTLLFSQFLKEEAAEVVNLRLIPFIGDAETAEFFAAAAGNRKQLPVFLKIDTGMGRMGCSPEDAPSLAAYIASLPAIKYAGTATHLAVSDSADPKDIEYTRLQISRFKTALDGIRGKGLSPGLVTAANTGATLYYPETWFDMARPGILLYGYPPDMANGAGPRFAARPVMELESAVVVIKRVKRGESVSYGRTWTAERDTCIGILPLGYGDGLPRGLSGKFSVIINGKSYPSIGRICMDQCMLDLGASPDIDRFSTASVFGGEMPGALDAAELARRVGTIPYEICCGITKRVPRVYTN